MSKVKNDEILIPPEFLKVMKDFLTDMISRVLRSDGDGGVSGNSMSYTRLTRAGVVLDRWWWKTSTPASTFSYIQKKIKNVSINMTVPIIVPKWGDNN